MPPSRVLPSHRDHQPPDRQLAGRPARGRPSWCSEMPERHPGHLSIDRSSVYKVYVIKAMQEPTFLILTALADGPQHGYGILSDAEQISAGRARLRAGTLYAALDRLQSGGLIAADQDGTTRP